MATRISGPEWQLDVNQDWIDVTSERSTPNEKWRFTDSNGHEHHYERGYPTLEYVIDAQHWCAGNEGMGPHDPHMAVDEAHYECLVCREVVEPLFDPPYTPKHIPGMRTATLTGRRRDGYTITMYVTDEELAQFGPDANGEVAARLLEDAPRERWLSWEVVAT